MSFILWNVVWSNLNLQTVMYYNIIIHLFVHKQVIRNCLSIRLATCRAHLRATLIYSFNHILNYHKKLAFTVKKSFSFILVNNLRHNILGHVSVAILRRNQGSTAHITEYVSNSCISTAGYTCFESISHEISSNTVM